MELIEWFKTITTAHVDKLIEDHQEEHLQLDFKTITRTNLSYRDDRRNLASCISGFANSSGGLVIWGVKARPDDRDVDCAVEPSLISPLSEFLSRLNEYTGQAASPIVDGVLHKALEKTASEGYAVTLVPESHSGPHMAKLGEDRYYKRSGGSFRKMEGSCPS